MASVLILCPYVHRPYFDAMFATLAPELAAGALVLDNTETNLGAAGSRNVGARRILAEGIDWLVDLSPAVRFGPHACRDFVASLDAHPDAWVVQSSAPVNWHCIAWSRRMFERVGLFDENFWPVYGEDGDISYRIHTAAREDDRAGVWACVDTDAWVTMYGHSQRLADVVADQTSLWAYYERKWDGLSGAERWTRPFDDPARGLDWWPVPPDPRALTHGGST